MDARRRCQGGFRPFFEMCTWRCASVHGLGKIVRGRHFADVGLDSYGGIKHLPRRRVGRPGRSVAVVPKDSASNVVVVPKDSWASAALADGMAVSNVAVLPNDGTDSAPPLPYPAWNRRRIGWESVLRRIVRTSPFCQSMASPGASLPCPGVVPEEITHANQCVVRRVPCPAPHRHGRTQTLPPPLAGRGWLSRRPIHVRHPSDRPLPPPAAKTGRTATFGRAIRPGCGNLSAERRRLVRYCGTGRQACGLWVQPI